MSTAGQYLASNVITIINECPSPVLVFFGMFRSECNLISL